MEDDFQTYLLLDNFPIVKNANIALNNLNLGRNSMSCWVFCTCDYVVGDKQEYYSEVMVVRGACKASAPLMDATLTEAVSTSTVAKDVLFLAGLYRNWQVLILPRWVVHHVNT